MDDEVERTAFELSWYNVPRTLQGSDGKSTGGRVQEVSIVIGSSECLTN